MQRVAVMVARCALVLEGRKPHAKSSHRGRERGVARRPKSTERDRCRSVFGLKSSGRKERVPGTRVGTWNVSQSPGTRSGRSDVPDFYE